MPDEISQPAETDIEIVRRISGAGSIEAADALAIVLAEFTHWSKAVNCPEVALGATAAAANIYAALRGIHRAPWHPPAPITPPTQVSRYTNG